MSYEGAWSRLAGWLALAVGFGLLGAACDQFHVQGLSGLVAPDEPALLAVAYVVVWIVRIGFREDRALLYPFGIALALAGCLVEAAEIELGWFSYADPDVIGVPFWLAGIYLHGAPLALDVARRVDAAGLASGLFRERRAAT